MPFTSPIVLRPHVNCNSHLFRMLRMPATWHFDAWLELADDYTLYLRTQTRAGGVKMLLQSCYRLDAERDGYKARSVSETPQGSRDVTMGQIVSEGHATWAALERVHWHYVLAMAARVHVGFTARSVALHYVDIPDVAPVDPLATNYVATYTRRAAPGPEAMRRLAL